MIVHKTGSGKTYTMWGPLSAMLEENSIDTCQGIAPRIFHMLFQEIQKVSPFFPILCVKWKRTYIHRVWGISATLGLLIRIYWFETWCNIHFQVLTRCESFIMLFSWWYSCNFIYYFLKLDLPIFIQKQENDVDKQMSFQCRCSFLEVNLKYRLSLVRVLIRPFKRIFFVCADTRWSNKWSTWYFSEESSGNTCAFLHLDRRR